MYDNDIWRPSNDIRVLHETKQILSKIFEIRTLTRQSFALTIEIHRDNLMECWDYLMHSLILSSKSLIYIIVHPEMLHIKDDKFFKSQYPKMNMQRRQ